MALQPTTDALLSISKALVMLPIHPIMSISPLIEPGWMELLSLLLSYLIVLPLMTKERFP